MDKHARLSLVRTTPMARRNTDRPAWWIVGGGLVGLFAVIGITVVLFSLVRS